MFLDRECVYIQSLHLPGEVSEWLKELAWKAGIRVQPRIAGSNPALSAKAGFSKSPAFCILGR